MDCAVIVPTFNRPELLQRAIRSAMEQTQAPFEILVVNDGSQPITLPEHPSIRIRLLETARHQGPTIARALAMENLSPNINAICYLDDDDELLPNHINLLLAALKDKEFAFSKALYRNKDGNETTDPEPANLGPKRYYNPQALLEQNIAPISSFMHTRKAYTEIGGWDTTLVRMEDWDFWGRMFIRFGPPAFVDDVTNIIYKGLGDNRTDSNQFVYSMACSWRDIVSDRLKALATEKRATLNERDLKNFHIPRVGVLMPVFNAEKHLREAVDSILAQNFVDFELLVINDGSTDNSRKICESYGDPRIRIFDMPVNSGVTKALNFGLLLSRSEYIARMDADDVSDVDRLLYQVKYLDANRDVMLLGSRFLSMNEDLTYCNWFNDVPTDYEDIEVKDDKGKPKKIIGIKNTLLDHCCIGHPTVMMRRRVIEILGGYDESQDCKAVEDYELWLRISRRFKISNLPHSLLRYREHDNQVSKKSSEIQKQNFEKVREKYRLLAT